MTDDGYDCLLAALDEAHARGADATPVRVDVLGERGRTFEIATGDHVGADGRVTVGDLVVDRASRTPDGGTLHWCGGHAMPGGDRLERFRLDGVGMTLAWSDPARANRAA